MRIYLHIIVRKRTLNIDVPELRPNRMFQTATNIGETKPDNCIFIAKVKMDVYYAMYRFTRYYKNRFLRIFVRNLSDTNVMVE